MARNEIVLLLMHLVNVMSFLYQKPVAEKVWSQKCIRGSHVLNDCNWCECDKRHQYNCHARLCSMVDMFGHFNDAIREINVGMEGRGVWRSSETPCEPRVHYRRKGLLCVCGDDGTWPNPVCRDSFQNLHPVEIIHDSKILNQKCTPNKFHLIGCNICFCPSKGRIDSEFCTKKPCNDNDPAVKKQIDDEDGAVEEVYADCNRNTKYKLGCQTCICLRNNRLICDNCTKELKAEYTYCSSKDEGESFNIECNTCSCNNKGRMHCTARKCLTGSEIDVLKDKLTYPDDEFAQVNKPIDDLDCDPGTKYKKGCSRCYCFEKDGLKMFACTLDSCSSHQDDIHSDCVEGTIYESNCLICHCVVHGEKRMQVCLANNQCTEKHETKVRSQDLRSLHGYCEPLHTYKKECNTCKCTADGQSVICTAKYCTYTPKNSLSVGIVPVIEKIGICPVGHYYKIDCNVCFCLSNGNAICTTDQCNNNNKYL